MTTLLSERVRGLKAVITAGSTIGQLDAVRFVEEVGLDLGVTPEIYRLNRFEIQNPFKGALGLRIAEALHRLGVHVTLLTRTDLLAGMKHELPASSIAGFRTFEDLERELPALLKDKQPELVWQAAAVSDWVPKAIEGIDESARGGKIESSAKVINVRFEATPKLIDDIRPLVGEKATIVGFKLAVQVTEERLASLAKRQIERAKTNYCVGNDNTLITKTCHPVFLYDALGTLRKFAGTKEETANWLVHSILDERF